MAEKPNVAPDDWQYWERKMNLEGGWTQGFRGLLAGGGGCFALWVLAKIAGFYGPGMIQLLVVALIVAGAGIFRYVQYTNSKEEFDKARKAAGLQS